MSDSNSVFAAVVKSPVQRSIAMAAPQLLEKVQSQQRRHRHQEEEEPLPTSSSPSPRHRELLEKQGRLLPRASSSFVVYEGKLPYASIFSTFFLTTLLAFMTFACLSQWAAVQLQSSQSNEPPPSQDLSTWNNQTSDHLQSRDSDNDTISQPATFFQNSDSPVAQGQHQDRPTTTSGVSTETLGDSQQGFSSKARSKSRKVPTETRIQVNSSSGTTRGRPSRRALPPSASSGALATDSLDPKLRVIEPFSTLDDDEHSTTKSAPKLAFLFLTRGPMPLRELWESFFKTSAGRASVYVHASIPGFDVNKTVNRSSLFWNSQVPHVRVKWGGFGMIDAEKRLLKAALADKHNTRFILLSESCIPLRSFDFVYSYLTASKLSFLATYPSTWRLGGVVIERAIPRRKLRKGSQWFALTRAHAKLAAEEKYYYGVFKQAGVRIPDETYFQTVLPLLDPKGFERRPVTFVQWYGYRWRKERTVDQGKLGPGSQAGRPRTFYVEDVNEKAIKKIQNMTKTFAERVSMKDFSEVLPCAQDGKAVPCYLFARKFAADAVTELVGLRNTLGY